MSPFDEVPDPLDGDRAAEICEEGNPHATCSLAEAANCAAAAMAAATVSGLKAALSPGGTARPFARLAASTRSRGVAAGIAVTASPANCCRSGREPTPGPTTIGRSPTRASQATSGQESLRLGIRITADCPKSWALSGPSTKPAYSSPGSREARARTSERRGPYRPRSGGEQLQDPWGRGKDEVCPLSL